VNVSGTVHRLRNGDQKVSDLAVLRREGFKKDAGIWRNPHWAFFMALFKLDLSEIMETLVFFLYVFHVSISDLT